MTCNLSTRASPNVNADEVREDETPAPAVTQKRWLVAELLVKEHGRTMGCPRCSSGIGMHNAECRGRIEGILLQQIRMKASHEVAEQRTKSVPMELEKPTGPAVQHGGSSGSGVQRNDATSIGATRFDDEKLPEVPDVEMFAEEQCAAKVKRAKTIMGLEMCVQEAQTSTTRPWERRRTWLRHLARALQTRTSWCQK